MWAAIRFARHNGNRPSTTRPQRRGRRYRSSRIPPTCANPDSVVTPRAAAYSINANSETRGAPGPATGSALSAKNPTHSAGSASFRTAHSMVAWAIATSTASRSALWPRSTASTSAVAADPAWVAVLVMDQPKHPAPTVMASIRGLSTGPRVTVG